MKKLMAIVLAALLLSACGGAQVSSYPSQGAQALPYELVSEAVEPERSYHYQHIKLDGRDCYVFSGANKGGLSCDWSGQ